MNYITKTEAFARHGATLTAPRGVWAKKSDDGKFVVLAAWRKGFNRDPFLPGKASYTFGDGSPNPTPNRICYFSPNICSALRELATHPQRTGRGWGSSQKEPGRTRGARRVMVVAGREATNPGPSVKAYHRAARAEAQAQPRLQVCRSDLAYQCGLPNTADGTPSA